MYVYSIYMHYCLLPLSHQTSAVKLSLKAATKWNSHV